MAQFSYISYVFYCFANFLCISLFLRLMYFIVFFFGIVWVLNINKYSSNFNCNESKYCILELKMEFWHKKPFSICFVHKSRKFSNFEPTLDYIMLRNFRTVRPIFPKIAPKVVQNLKEKSHESSRRGKKNSRNYRAKRRGGGGFRPPPALLGLSPPGLLFLVNVVHVYDPPPPPPPPPHDHVVYLAYVYLQDNWWKLIGLIILMMI